MHRLVTELLSPSQMGPAITRMSAAQTLSWTAGHSSTSHPCSVMSGHTPVATSWSTRRTTSVVTPCFCMISADASTNASVLDTSGDFLSVQLMNNARSPVKSGAPPSCRTASSAMRGR